MADVDDKTKKAEAKKGEAKEEAKKEEGPKEEKAEVKKAEKDQGGDKKKEEEAAEPKKEEDVAEAKKKENDAKPEAVAKKKENDAKPPASATAVSTSPAAAAPAAEETPKRTKKRKKSQLDKLLEGDISVPTSTKRERKSLASYKPEDFSHPSERASVEGGGGEGGTPGARDDLPVPLGRGTKLSDLESVCQSIKRTKTKGPILAAAHKLVFTTRGRAAARNMKPQLLKFYGYLPPVKEDVPKEEWDQIEEDIEAKMSEKAYKLKNTVLKDLCDLFDVDRRPPEGKSLIDKDTLVDRLLNFLGEPKESMTKTAILAKEGKTGKGRATPKKGGKKKKKSTTPKKKTKAKKRKEWEESDEESSEDEPSEDETEEEESDEEEEGAIEADAMEVDGEGKGEGEGGDKGKTKDGDDQAKAKAKEEGGGGEKTSTSSSAKKKKPKKKKKQPKLPSDNALRRWVRAYVRCFNLDKATTKHAIETASDKFGVDLTEKKGRIKELLTEEMS